MAGEFPIVFALYPRITQLDFTGPLEVLARLPGAAIVVAAVRGGELALDSGITFANVRPLACCAVSGRRVTGRFANCCRCSAPSRTRGAWCATATSSRAAE